MFYQQGARKFINLIPKPTPKSPGLMPTTDSQLTMSLGVTKSGRRHLPLILGRQRDWKTFCQATKAVCPTILFEWLGDSCLISIMHPLIKTVGGTATQCTPGMTNKPKPGGTYTCHGHAASILAIQSKYSNKQQNIGGDSTLKEKYSSAENLWHNWHSLSDNRHLGVRLLLWQSSKTNNTLTVSIRVCCGGRSTLF